METSTWTDLHPNELYTKHYQTELSVIQWRHEKTETNTKNGIANIREIIQKRRRNQTGASYLNAE